MTTTTTDTIGMIHANAVGERETLFAHYADEADTIMWAEYDEKCARLSLLRSSGHGSDDCPSCGGCGLGPTPDTNCGVCHGRGGVQ